MPLAVGEVRAGVVDDVIGADRADQIGLGRAAHPGYLGPEVLGELDGVAADASGRTNDQDLLPWLDAPGVAQALKGGEPGHRDGGSLLEAQRGRLADQRAFPRGGVLGERAAGDTEHLVPGGESGHGRADRDNRARHVQSGHAVPRPAEPEAQQPHQIRLARHHMPGAPVHPGRPDLDEDLVVADAGPGHLAQPQHVLRHGAVPALRDRPHRGRAGRRDRFCLLGQLCRLHRISL